MTLLPCRTLGLKSNSNKEKKMNFISIPQAADLLKKTRQYIWVLIKNGKLRGKKVGRNYILPATEVDRYLKTKKEVK
jgi:excisionase family DNA binding protein